MLIAHTPQHLKIVAIIPALNESQAIAQVIHGLKQLTWADGAPLFQAIVVGDNGSTDTTCQVARQAGARVAQASARGYGHGCMAAIQAAPNADVYIFVDGDHTTRYAQIPALIQAIVNGASLAVGRRTERARGSMSWPQRVGNALCCALIRLLWRAPVHDLGPLRAIRAPLFHALDMRAMTYGWTLEMQIKAFEQGCVVTEVPVATLARPYGTSRVSATLGSALRCGRVMLSTIFSLYASRAQRAQDLAPAALPLFNK
jgi:glycosyltransferase involved in cell wall biosynthesis